MQPEGFLPPLFALARVFAKDRADLSIRTATLAAVVFIFGDCLIFTFPKLQSVAFFGRQSVVNRAMSIGTVNPFHPP